MGWLVKWGPTVFSEGETQGGATALRSLRVGRVDRVLLIASGMSCPAHSPTSNRPITQMGTLLRTDRLSPPCFPPGGTWRRCQFQALRSRSSLEDYPIRIDKHVRDVILPGALVISTAVVELIIFIMFTGNCLNTMTQLTVHPLEATIASPGAGARLTY